MTSPVTRLRLAGFILFLAVAGLDQWSKSAILAAAAEGRIPKELTSFFSLVLVHNRGISFGFFGQGAGWMPGLLTLFTSLVALGLAVWLARVRDWATAICLGLVIGGAVGNILDRLRLGSVTDFLDFHLGARHWPAFNVADSGICIGVVILVLISIVRPHTNQETAT